MEVLHVTKSIDACISRGSLSLDLLLQCLFGQLDVVWMLIAGCNLIVLRREPWMLVMEATCLSKAFLEMLVHLLLHHVAELLLLGAHEVVFIVH
jgi:hypothetical protein